MHIPHLAIHPSFSPFLIPPPVLGNSFAVKMGVSRGVKIFERKKEQFCEIITSVTEKGNSDRR